MTKSLRDWPAASVRSLSLAALLALPLLGGCPHPSQTFDDFVERYPEAKIVDMAQAPSSAFDVGGPFLLSLSTVIDPGKPLVFLMTNTFTANADGTASIDMSIQPLTVTDVDNNKKPDRKPSGNPIIAKGVAVDKTGNFSVDLGVQTVAGDTNPISGSDITSSLKLVGSIRSKDRMCGSLEGMLMKPFPADIKGSTFGAVRVDPAMMGEALPAPDYVQCGGGGGGDMASSPDM